MTTTRILDRTKISVGGFTAADRTGGHVDRHLPPPAERVRLIVAGAAGTHGLCYTDADLHENTDRGATRPGPWLHAYERGTAIDNHGGTGAEIARERIDGRLVEVEPGDILAMIDPAAEHGRTMWRVDVDASRRVRLVRVDTGAEVAR